MWSTGEGAAERREGERERETSWVGRLFFFPRVLSLFLRLSAPFRGRGREFGWSWGGGEGPVCYRSACDVWLLCFISRGEKTSQKVTCQRTSSSLFFFFSLTRPNSGRPFSLSPSPVPSLFIYTPCMPCFGISLQVRGPRDGGGVMPAGTRPPRGGGRCKKEGLLAASQFRNSQHPARGARTGRCRRCHASSLPGCLRQSAPLRS